MGYRWVTRSPNYFLLLFHSGRTWSYRILLFIYFKWFSVSGLYDGCVGLEKTEQTGCVQISCCEQPVWRCERFILNFALKSEQRPTTGHFTGSYSSLKGLGIRFLKHIHVSSSRLFNLFESVWAQLIMAYITVGIGCKLLLFYALGD